MTSSDIVHFRLVNQQIARTTFTTPDRIVSHLVAMQAQDFAMAKWAIGVRLPGWNNTDIENEFNKGTILRTHLLRPTWHFVTPKDIRWMLALTAPRVQQINSHMYRKVGLTDKILNKSIGILTKALKGGNHCTRTALQSVLKKNKIAADGLRLGYIMMNAELERVICSGPRIGKQFTYALLEERAVGAISLSRGEALHELTKRYFASRGPATLNDFAVWSGLTMKDVKEGTDSLPSRFIRKTIEGKEYIVVPIEWNDRTKYQTTFLMSDYDEYGMGYKDRSAYFIPESRGKVTERSHLVVIDGVIGGTWTRTVKGTSLVVETSPFFPLNKQKKQALQNGVKKYSMFFGDGGEET